MNDSIEVDEAVRMLENLLELVKDGKATTKHHAIH